MSDDAMQKIIMNKHPDTSKEGNLDNNINIILSL